MAQDSNGGWVGNGKGMRGFFMAQNRNKNGGGGARRFRDVTDGLSNTVALGERIKAKDNANSIKLGALHAPDNNSNTIIFSPILCYAEVSNGGVYNNVGNDRGARLAGVRAFDGAPAFTGCNTILPPNSPSCKRGGNAHDRDGIFSMSSHHTGGAQVALGDGSVRFISDNIDSGDLTVRAVDKGRSPYGIWGALGSVQGGETLGEF